MSNDLELSDADYVLSMIDETFASVPQIKAHHDRIRKIADRLRARQAPAPVEVSRLARVATGLTVAEWLQSAQSNLCKLSDSLGFGGGALLDDAIGSVARAIQQNESDLAAASTPVGEVPAGWKLVPVEPTPAMLAAWPNNRHGSGHEAAIYKAMLAASPAPAASKGAEAWEWKTPPASWRLIAKAAINLLCAIDERHDNNPPPLKYSVPYGAVNDLRRALGAADPAPSEPEAQKAVARIKRGAQTPWGFAGILVEWLPGLQDLPPGEHEVYTSPSPAASMEVQGLDQSDIAKVLALLPLPPKDGGELYDWAERCAAEAVRALAAKNGWRLGEGRG